MMWALSQTPAFQHGHTICARLPALYMQRQERKMIGSQCGDSLGIENGVTQLHGKPIYDWLL